MNNGNMFLSNRLVRLVVFSIIERIIRANRSIYWKLRHVEILQVYNGNMFLSNRMVRLVVFSISERIIRTDSKCMMEITTCINTSCVIIQLDGSSGQIR